MRTGEQAGGLRKGVGGLDRQALFAGQKGHPLALGLGNGSADGAEGFCPGDLGVATLACTVDERGSKAAEIGQCVGPHALQAGKVEQVGGGDGWLGVVAEVAPSGFVDVKAAGKAVVESGHAQARAVAHAVCQNRPGSRQVVEVVDHRGPQ